jgi:cytochrome b561
MATLGVMKRDTLLRALSFAGLAMVIGLIAARVPSLSEPQPSFSWLGMFIGFALVAAALLLSRLFVPAATRPPLGTPTQRLLLKAALALFLVTLVLFVGLLYTDWALPRLMIGVTVTCGALTVFAGVFVTWFGKNDR